MRPLRNLALQVLSASLVSFALAFLGCQTEAPSSPSTDIKIQRATHQLQFLTPEELRFPKSFSSEEYIFASQGGTILVGDEVSGFSSINFAPGDLSDDTEITFGWNSQGYFTELSPHGIVFNEPVRISLSYKDANLTNVVEDDIQIWYFNDSDNSWELIGGDVDKNEKQVDGYIKHFSKYALAEDD